ncbi:MAG: DegT/DnrJ/EryC1/StrS aminotransferase family protein [Candidatus Eiseniibacteriota bacterium]
MSTSRRLDIRSEFLPFHRPAIGEAEIAAVTEVLRSGWLTTGARARALEAAFAGQLGLEPAAAAAVSSCTAALHLGLRLLEVGPGDEVLLPTTTFAATANVVVHLGARPVFCDIDPRTQCLDPRDLAARVTPRSRAVVPVHLGGHPCDMTAIGEVATRHGLAVLEDAAHAIETVWGGQRAGTLGDAGAFSFYATKAITTGEGGMLVSRRPELVDAARILALHGLSRDAWRRYDREGDAHYEVVDAGYKYNLPDVLAAIGLVQLEKLHELWGARRVLVERYVDVLDGLPVTWQPTEIPGGRHAHHLFLLGLRPEAPLARDALAVALRERQIGTSIHFRPLHLQPFYRETCGCRAGDLPVAEAVYGASLSLPLFPDMTVGDVDYVAGHLRDLLGA